MGEIRVKVKLCNDVDLSLAAQGKLAPEKIRSAEIDAVVDTGAVMTLLPRDVVEKLGLRPLGTIPVRLADESTVSLPRAGSLSLMIGDRDMTTNCLVGPPGCEPLIGQIVMEELDLIPDPRRRTLGPRPESPSGPTLKMKLGGQAGEGLGKPLDDVGGGHGPRRHFLSGQLAGQAVQMRGQGRGAKALVVGDPAGGEHLRP